MNIKKNALSLLISLIFIISSCEKDRCDEGYKEVNVNGQDICVLKFNIGIEFPIENGTKLYHEKVGVIEFNNGEWKNQIGENVNNLIKNEN